MGELLALSGSALFLVAAASVCGGLLVFAAICLVLSRMGTREKRKERKNRKEKRHRRAP